MLFLVESVVCQSSPEVVDVLELVLEPIHPVQQICHRTRFHLSHGTLQHEHVSSGVLVRISNVPKNYFGANHCAYQKLKKNHSMKLFHF